MSFKNKPMENWGSKDVKAWIKSLDAFNDKQKKLITAGVDNLEIDGDSLACSTTADDLKDALDIPIILARKLLRQVQSYQKKKGGKDSEDEDEESGSDDESESDEESSSEEATKKKKKKKSKKSSKKDKKKKKKRKKESSSEEEESSSEEESDGDDKDNDSILQKLIARNLKAKNDKVPDQSKKSSWFPSLGGSSSNTGKSKGSSMNYSSGGDGFQVNIQGASGKLLVLNQKCTKHTKVRQVKQYLANQEGGTAEKMTLKCNGVAMKDEDNLGVYGIANSRNLITVSYKVVGGIY